MIELKAIQSGFLALIILILLIYFLTLACSLIKNRRNINFLQPILNSKGTLSKSSLLFLFLTLIISYQALFIGEVTSGLIEILAVLALKDAGINCYNRWSSVQDNKTTSDEKVNMEKIRLESTKTTKNVKMKPEEFNDL